MRILSNLLLTFLLVYLSYFFAFLVLALLYGLPTAIKLKWVLCGAFMVYQYLDLKSRKYLTLNENADNEQLEELKKLKEKAVDTVPEDNDELIKWFTEEDSNWKRVDPDKFKDMKFEVVMQDKVIELDSEIRLLLSYMLEPEEQEIAETALITDESMIFDFFFIDEEMEKGLQRLKDKLGSTAAIEPGNYLWEAVIKVKYEFPNWPDNLSKLRLVK